MRICLVSETWSPDINGVAHTLQQLTRQLLERGMTLQLVRPAPQGESHSEPDMSLELQVRGFAMPGYSDVRLGLPADRRLRAMWQKQRPDVVYVATEGPLGWSALRCAERLNIPVVSGWHTNFDHYCRDYGVGWLEPLVTRRLRHFHNRCHATLVPTHHQAEALTARGFERVGVMARGIDGEQFSPAHRCSELRPGWDSDGHRPVALHVGRLAAEKNLGVLRETCAALLNAYPEMRIVVVGDGPQRESLQKALPDVHFTGFIDARLLAQHYASADFFLFPSLSETWGNVVLEAMASGLAVVAFRHAAGRELIAHEVNGLHLEPNDSAAFRDAALSLARQPERCARLGEAARERALQYRWPAITDEFVAALNLAREAQHEDTEQCRV
ncbi:glycosyltransferase family 1 protein [Halomonas sp. 18H]|uniref:glycosyltransferase family 4 protein n=1 Tax=Halomonas almeriensis TaxID=308163 RepID=UPI002230D611|nr:MULTISPECIES: glycosyltransferase family 1 protein [Halomonas]MCW4151815.1 glycosyltransferase family 1 protein [Halomonas sp. 18H]MDN3554061.1 glycosyltransferase family 1 protein [Halomonas almeriensis]